MGTHTSRRKTSLLAPQFPSGALLVPPSRQCPRSLTMLARLAELATALLLLNATAAASKENTRRLGFARLGEYRAAPCAIALALPTSPAQPEELPPGTPSQLVPRTFRTRRPLRASATVLTLVVLCLEISALRLRARVRDGMRLGIPDVASRSGRAGGGQQLCQWSGGPPRCSVWVEQ